jgi:hypothetical protein
MRRALVALASRGARAASSSSSSSTIRSRALALVDPLGVAAPLASAPARRVGSVDGRFGARHASSRASASASAASDLDAFVRACCTDLGRGDDDETVAAVADALRADGRRVVDDLADFSETRAMSLGVPLRLAVAMRRRLNGAAVSSAPEPPPTLNRIHLADEDEDAHRAPIADDDVSDDVFASSSEASASSATREALLRRGIMPRPFRGETPGNAADVRVTRRPPRARMVDYRIPLSECPPELLDEFARFRRFLTARRLGASAPPVKEVTAKKYEDQIRGLLGWMRLTIPREYPTESLTSMRVAFPTKSKRGAALAFEHLQWLSDARKCGAKYEMVALRAFIAAAKFLWGDEDEEDDTERPYANVPIVRQLRKINKDAGRRAQNAGSASDVRKKWLSWDQYIDLVRSLEDECAPRLHDGGARSDSAVAWSLQRYLIFGVLSCVPDRQRTIRELEIGRTLFKEPAGKDAKTARAAKVEDESSEYQTSDEGLEIVNAERTGWIDLKTSATAEDYDYRWVIRHGPDDYKTGKDYGVRPPMVISPKLYGAMEEWIRARRAHLKPTHNFLFTSKNGGPLTDNAVHRLLTSTSYRLTGRRTNPHLIRDMIITHLRGTDASERELEALAIYMGHSVAMQKGTYDRRTKEEKVAPAVDLLDAVNAGFAR